MRTVLGDKLCWTHNVTAMRLSLMNAGGCPLIIDMETRYDPDWFERMMHE